MLRGAEIVATKFKNTQPPHLCSRDRRDPLLGNAVGEQRLLSRDNDGFSCTAAIFDMIRGNPTFAATKVIVEPWDYGPGGRRIGDFPNVWREMNDEFRDTVRDRSVQPPHSESSAKRPSRSLAMPGSAGMAGCPRRGRMYSVVYARVLGVIGVVLIEAGVVTGYVIAWAVRKARRAAGRLDTDVDAAIDSGLDRLHEVVAARLGAHPVLDDLGNEAATGDEQISELTRQQVELAVATAAGKDDLFGRAVTELVARLRAAEQAAGVSVVAGAGTRVFAGDAHAHASGGGISFGQVGGDAYVDSVGREGKDPSGPGRSSH